MPSLYLSSLSPDARKELTERLHAIQGGNCFICEEPIDLEIQANAIDIDHVQPLAVGGKDAEENFALAHSHCNRSKQASDLRVARVLARFDRIKSGAQDAGKDAPNLADLLTSYGGARFELPISVLENRRVRYGFPDLPGHDGTTVHEADLYRDDLAGMHYFFALFPIEYLHFDDKINPRGIGGSLRGLIEEFFKGNPQLHVSLCWAPLEPDGDGHVMMFDGQHKAAAQILLGQRWLPMRVFVNPDPDRLIETNTNAGSILRQVAFDKSVLRHLGSELYADRVRRYQEAKGLPQDDESFSETDLVVFFAGEARAVRRYVLDAVRTRIAQQPDNRLKPYIEFGGRGNERPISYSTIDKTFFSLFISQDMLTTPIGYGVETNDNPRLLEVEQIVHLMNLIASEIYEGQWDFQRGAYQIEARLQKGEDLPEGHLRAFRMGKEEVITAWLRRYVRDVIEQYYLMNGLPKPRAVMQKRHPEPVWERLQTCVRNLAKLPMWMNRDLSLTAFGGKQASVFWETVFETGKTPHGEHVLAKPLGINDLLQ